MPTKTYIKRSVIMARSSLSLGIASIACVFFAPELTLALSPLGIIIALLSRDDSRQFHKYAKYTIVICILTYIATIAVFAVNFVSILEKYGGIDNVIELIRTQLESLGYTIN